MEPYPDNPPIPDGPAAAKNVKEMVESGRRKREQEAPLRRAAIIQIGTELADVDAAVECYCDCHPKPASRINTTVGYHICQLSEKERKKKFQELLKTVIWEEASADSGTAEDGYRMKVYSAAEKEGATIRGLSPLLPRSLSQAWWRAQFLSAGTPRCVEFSLSQGTTTLPQTCGTVARRTLVIAGKTTSGWDWQNTQMVTDAIKEVKHIWRRVTAPHGGAHTYCPD